MKHPFVKSLFVVIVIALFLTCYNPQIKSSSAGPAQNWEVHPMHLLQSVEPSISPNGLSPSQIKTAYNLPSTGGNGSTIAVIDVGDTPSIRSDLTMFSNTFSLKTPTNDSFEIVRMSGVGNASSDWMMETCLDIEWAHAIAPDAKILLVEAQSATSNDLLSAINYARNRTDVVAVSMSFGGQEFSGENSFDFHFRSTHGAAFFASSGDAGSSTGVTWPASSSNVVGVGGTVLSFEANGSVESEIAWNGSGGGVSAYESLPSYQTNFGLTLSNRAVPDVSYVAGTGVAVFCSSHNGWITVGGTSVGAPQWAAIQALRLSATNTNLYEKAKSAYSSYFRDIIIGTNGGYNATTGYDYVTGLGSPLTFDFSTHLSVSPTSGPAGGAITINGVGFTPGSSVNISYLNPVTSKWVSIINNSSIAAQNFSYSFNAPDLLQNNPSKDSQPLFDKLIFRTQDNGNGNSYNTTTPYTELRRGLTQVAGAVATGIYGNNSDLLTTAFVQNSQPITVAGDWFNPGNVSLMLDGTMNLGNAATDLTGLFNTTIQVPSVLAGQHTLNIDDNTSHFSIYITREPLVTNDYDGKWHTSPFNITLTPDYNISETYYSINGGQVFNVTANGQPSITSDSNNDTLEYWSNWNVYGTGNINLTHITLTGIQLDTIQPQASILINDGATTTSSNSIALTITANDDISGISQMRFSNDNSSWGQSQWTPFATSQDWQLTNGNGLKTVYCQIENSAGLVTTVSSSTTLTVTTSIPILPPSIVTPVPTQMPQQTPKVTPAPTASPTLQPSPVGIVPELSIQMFLILAAIATLLFAVIYKRKHL